MVVYNYDSNAILAITLKDKTAESIWEAYEKIVKKLRKVGIEPKLQKMDNKCSSILKDYMDEEGIEYQLTAPYQHRTNAAERAIRTFKNHLIAGLCTLPEDFPIELWDELIEQAELTLNLMRGSRLHPQM